MAEAAHAVSPDTVERGLHPNQFAVDEVAAALTYTRRKAESELGKALRLTRELPEVHAALESGDIDSHKASAISDATTALKGDTARGSRRQDPALRGPSHRRADRGPDASPLHRGRPRLRRAPPTCPYATAPPT